MSEKKYSVLQNDMYRSGDFSISSITDTYIQTIREWRNSQLDILRQKKIISAEEQATYFNDVVFAELDHDFPVQVLFNYFYQEKFVGYGGIVHISAENETGEISFLLDPLLTKDGFYEKAFSIFLYLMDIIGFKELRLQKLFTETYQTRFENVAILEKAGYEREGVLRSHKSINNKRVDVYLHGKLKSN